MATTNPVTSFVRTMLVASQLTRRYKNPTSLSQLVAKPDVALLSLLVYQAISSIEHDTDRFADVVWALPETQDQMLW